MGIFGGGGSSSSATNTTNVEVTVNPEITNTVVVDDSRLQKMIDKLAEGNEIAAASVQSQADATKAAALVSASNADKLAETIKAAVITAVVGLAVTRMLGR